jgi:pyridoxamine 5'-phosphate oxidase
MAQFTKNSPLNESDLPPAPRALLERWLADAIAAPMQEPTAMTLATADADGTPSARIVLFKGFHEDGLTFYTNYESHKGIDLAANAKVALVFWWDKLERQVRIEGRAQKLPEEVSRNYFYQRIRDSQLGAITSRQSQVVATREELDARLDANEQRYQDMQVPFPPYWGGYVVTPSLVEFWQGRHGRLHDRLQYRSTGLGWITERLEP